VSYWLLKSEPETFGITNLRASPRRTTCWDGVRNFQARNFLRDRVRKGDLAFFYHSNCAQPGIVGIVRIARSGYPDHTAFDPRDAHFDPKSDPAAPTWYMVDVALERELRRIITLEELKRRASKELEGFALLKRGNRLSVMPVADAHWNFILSLE
jgi:predicted RNA-binding protein with PUA-like domain